MNYYGSLGILWYIFLNFNYAYRLYIMTYGSRNYKKENCIIDTLYVGDLQNIEHDYSIWIFFWLKNKVPSHAIVINSSNLNLGSMLIPLTLKLTLKSHSLTT